MIFYCSYSFGFIDFFRLLLFNYMIDPSETLCISGWFFIHVVADCHKTVGATMCYCEYSQQSPGENVLDFYDPAVLLFA